MKRENKYIVTNAKIFNELALRKKDQKYLVVERGFYEVKEFGRHIFKNVNYSLVSITLPKNNNVVCGYIKTQLMKNMNAGGCRIILEDSPLLSPQFEPNTTDLKQICMLKKGEMVEVIPEKERSKNIQYLCAEDIKKKDLVLVRKFITKEDEKKEEKKEETGKEEKQENEENQEKKKKKKEEKKDSLETIEGYVGRRFAKKIERINTETYKVINRRNGNNLYEFTFVSVGIFHSCFPERTGTPRQGTVSGNTKGYVELTLNQCVCLDGLEDFSYVWLLFVFHRNKTSASDFAQQPKKIRPPRLGGKKLGVFATRSPHRVNPIGLTAAKVEKIEKDEKGKFAKLHVSGIDLVDLTPIIDIKPYVPYSDSFKDAKYPTWVSQKTVTNPTILSVTFSKSSLENLEKAVPKLQFFSSFDEVKTIITDVIMNDPRPIYVKRGNENKLFGFRVDCLGIRFDVDNKTKNANVAYIDVWNSNSKDYKSEIKKFDDQTSFEEEKKQEEEEEGEEECEEKKDEIEEKKEEKNEKN